MEIKACKRCIFSRKKTINCAKCIIANAYVYSDMAMNAEKNLLHGQTKHILYSGVWCSLKLL